MFIAVAAEGRDLDSGVSEQLEDCLYLLIVNMENMSVQAFENSCDQNGADLVERILGHDCEVIITGGLGADTFEPLAEACVTRYDGSGYSARTALGLMETYRLKLIRNPEKTEECSTDHHESACDGSAHEADA